MFRGAIHGFPDAPTRRLIPSLIYIDNRAALQWLQTAFGFEPSEILADSEGKIVHAEMTHGDGVIMFGSEWADWTRSPASLGGKNTQRVVVRIERGIDSIAPARDRPALASSWSPPINLTASAATLLPIWKATTGRFRKRCERSRPRRSSALRDSRSAS